MTRKEFMYRLAEQLLPLPAEERVSALKYYDEYFDDAGPENEQKIISELGDPRAVAEGIIREYAQNNPGWRPAPPAGGGPGRPAAGSGGAVPQPGTKSPGSSTWIWILVAVLTCWLWIPVVVTVLGVAAGLMAAAVGIAGGLILAAGAVVVAGAVIFCAGFGLLAAAPGTGLLGCGTGLALAGVGILSLVLVLWLAVKAVPAVFRAVVGVLRLPFHHRKGGQQV